MTCSVPKDKNYTEGLAGGHAYTLIDVFNVSSKGKTWKLLKIRNPWGKKDAT